MNAPEEYHYSVLLEPVMEFASVLKDREGPVIVDGTLGAAGHTLEFQKRFPGAVLYGFDRDPEMVGIAKKRILSENLSFQEVSAPSKKDSPGIYIINRSFGFIDSLFSENDMKADFVILDLGVSIHHFRDIHRGFSYNDETLDMRLSPDIQKSAVDILQEKSEQELIEIFQELGEEKYSGRIARKIKENLPIHSARHLSRIVMDAVRTGQTSFRQNSIHPATRIFQALRIYVNEELDVLQNTLNTLPGILNPAGRLAVISFHSLEDRIVKNAFKKIGKKPKKEISEKRQKYVKNDSSADFLILTPAPAVPDREEIEKNPPSRSAKLRVIEKIHRK